MANAMGSSFCFTWFHVVSLLGGGAVAALLIGLLAARSLRVRSAWLTIAVAFALPTGWILVNVFFPELVDARRRSYMAFYRDVHVGMTRDQVFAALAAHYPQAGTRRRPIVMEDSAARIGFFMDAEGASDPNCEGIFLDVQEGRVVEKQYSAD